MPKKGISKNPKTEAKEDAARNEEEKPDLLLDASISQARKGAKYSLALQKLVDTEKARMIPGVGAIHLVGCVEAREIQANILMISTIFHGLTTTIFFLSPYPTFLNQSPLPLTLLAGPERRVLKPGLMKPNPEYCAQFCAKHDESFTDNHRILL
uniref:Uncharacterized protein n=1 Tax=Ditylenchus dipsaci TaxID=166011 RepID=A0A915CY38_9BILA